jgi:hypothetical protein
MSPLRYATVWIINPNLTEESGMIILYLIHAWRKLRLAIAHFVSFMTMLCYILCVIFVDWLLSDHDDNDKT